jgi:probable F420-dependent oxidoreductase
MLDPFVGLASVASSTTTLKLGTAISLALERNPLLMAKTVATLDQVSEGRVVLGIGSGWLEEEGDVFGVDWKRRGTQLREHVSAMKRCWIDDESSHDGEFYSFPKLINKPKPVQRPHPPILLAGEMSVVAKRAARWANGWIPRYVWSSVESIREGHARMADAFSAEGRDPGDIDITLFGMRANRDEILQWQDAGCTRVLFVLPPTAETDVLSRLDHIASRVFD